MTQKVSWREARELLTGAAGDGLVGANQAQQILDDLARFPETTQFYRNSDSQGYLSYAGTDPGDQPQYLKVARKL